MKKILEKIQQYGSKAEQFRQALEAGAGKAAELRESVLMTAGQLKDMRREVQASVAGLRAEDDQKMTAALNEVQQGADELRRAGYQLAGVEMELDPVQRLILLLEKVEDVSDRELRSVLAANANRRTLHGVLSSLIKAEEFADHFTVGDLEYCQLRVSVGPIPSVRLIWKGPEALAVEAPPALPGSPSVPTPIAQAAPKPAIASATSVFGRDSFFEPRATLAVATAVPVAAAPEEPTAAAPPSSTAPQLAKSIQEERKPEPAPEPDAAWRSSALDRFKKMPNLGGRRK